MCVKGISEDSGYPDKDNQQAVSTCKNLTQPYRILRRIRLLST